MVEDLLAKIGDGMGNDNTCEAAAKRESPITDGGDCIGNVDAGDASKAPECHYLDGDYRITYSLICNRLWDNECALCGS